MDTNTIYTMLIEIEDVMFEHIPVNDTLTIIRQFEQTLLDYYSIAKGNQNESQPLGH